LFKYPYIGLKMRGLMSIFGTVLRGLLENFSEK